MLSHDETIILLIIEHGRERAYMDHGHTVDKHTVDRYIAQEILEFIQTVISRVKNKKEGKNNDEPN